jgi:peptide-methionine (S)-S-oxide reductase
MTTQTITLGGGCFWCTEAVYLNVRGVTAVESGYTNGYVKNPTYEQVCTGRTGHNEVVKITFDGDVISLDQILQIFFVVHDSGTQYRSGIYVNSGEQEAAAKAFISKLIADKTFSQITTEVAFVDNYSKAEDYHQHYFANNPNQGYCAFVVGPKVEKFRKTFAQLSLT